MSTLRSCLRFLLQLLVRWKKGFLLRRDRFFAALTPATRGAVVVFALASSGVKLVGTADASLGIVLCLLATVLFLPVLILAAGELVHDLNEYFFF